MWTVKGKAAPESWYNLLSAVAGLQKKIVWIEMIQHRKKGYRPRNNLLHLNREIDKETKQIVWSVNIALFILCIYKYYKMLTMSSILTK